MRQHLVLTATGSDRPGLVERVTRLIVEHGGNVESSRMARLGGEFAMLVLVAAPVERIGGLREAVDRLGEGSYVVHTRLTGMGPPVAAEGRVTIRVLGADHMGIIHAVARDLARRSVNVETLDTEVAAAPMSGQPLFRMQATVSLPPGLSREELARALEAVGDEMNVEITVEPTGG